MFYSFQMHQGVVVLKKYEDLDLAFVFRVTDNKQVYCVVWWDTRKALNKHRNTEIQTESWVHQNHIYSCCSWNLILLVGDLGAGDAAKVTKQCELLQWPQEQLLQIEEKKCCAMNMSMVTGKVGLYVSKCKSVLFYNI